MPKHKPEKIYVDGVKYFFWKYEKQTKVKHQVLVAYFEPWVKILGQNSKVCFFDCFGGCGAYIDEAGNQYYGSPFLLAEKASELKDSLNRDTEIFVVEEDADAFANLQTIKEERSDLKILPQLANSTFEAIIHNSWTKKVYETYPCFFFIDPFGFSIKLADMIDIMKFPKNEMFINFMYDHVSRFLEKEDLHSTYDDFFGTSEWRDAFKLSGEARENKIIEVYRKQLKRVAKYVFAFRMSYPDRARTYYYLFHVTNSIKGCTIMKSAFAAQNLGRVEYLGERGNALTIFDLSVVKQDDIKMFLQERYPGRSISFEQICDEIIDETFYLEKDIRAAIQGMRKTKEVSVVPVTSKSNRGLQGKDIVTFL